MFFWFDFEYIKSSKVVTEDIIFSYAIALHFGLKAMDVTPQAVVYYKPQTTPIDELKKSKRTQVELNKIESFFPYFKMFRRILTRKTLASPSQASSRCFKDKTEMTKQYTQSDGWERDDWNRLESTKGLIRPSSMTST